MKRIARTLLFTALILPAGVVAKDTLKVVEEYNKLGLYRVETVAFDMIVEYRREHCDDLGERDLLKVDSLLLITSELHADYYMGYVVSRWLRKEYPENLGWVAHQALNEAATVDAESWFRSLIDSTRFSVLDTAYTAFTNQFAPPDSLPAGEWHRAMLNHFGDQYAPLYAALVIHDLRGNLQPRWLPRTDLSLTTRGLPEVVREVLRIFAINTPLKPVDDETSSPLRLGMDCMAIAAHFAVTGFRDKYTEAVELAFRLHPMFESPEILYLQVMSELIFARDLNDITLGRLVMAEARRCLPNKAADFEVMFPQFAH